MSDITINPALRQQWARRDLFGLTLLTMFMDSYGTDGLSWLPETIEMEIADDFEVQIDDQSFDRLLTAITILTTNSFTTSLPDFARACVVLSGEAVSAAVMSLPDSRDIAWGITEGLLISPPEGQQTFNEEIVGFIGAVLDQEGIVNPPDVLRIAGQAETAQRINQDFSDDPEMFSAIWKEEQAKGADIDQFVRGNMRKLLQQVVQLPLTNGQTGHIRHLMKKFN